MQDIIATLERYVNDRCPTGGFLHAVLSNDLIGACGKADMVNQGRLPNIVSYIYNNLPMNCYGSPKKVNDWLNREDENDG